MSSVQTIDRPPVATPVPPPRTTPAFFLPRPTNPVMKALLKGPILAWRLGLGFLVGRNLMIVTTTGRQSGQPRRTALGFYAQHGRKYVFTLRGPGTDWYRNILADPRVTLQTAAGREQVVARQVTAATEFGEAYQFLGRLPVMQRWAAALGVTLSREAVVAHRKTLILITFEPTTAPTPRPLEADLTRVWPPVAALLVLGLLLGFVRHATPGQRTRV